MTRITLNSNGRHAIRMAFVLAECSLLFSYVGCMPDVASLQAGNGSGCANGDCAGASSTGGVQGTGGATGDGGGAATGGLATTGGESATGGAATGGLPATGGESATGGAATGGLPATGGESATGGAATGGLPATGGESATGGAATGGQPATSDAGPQIHFDFETSLQGWQPVGDQRPPDVQDSVVKSSDEAFNGSSSLAMVFDGIHATTDSAPFWGVYTNTGVPPANATVTLWMYATAAGASANVYVQLTPDYAWKELGNKSLPAGVWTMIQVAIPDNMLFRFGCTLSSSQDYAGTVYLDDISW